VPPSWGMTLRSDPPRPTRRTGRAGPSSGSRPGSSRAPR
jgi:hypothetical protein